jgi:hypothetical protein
MFMEELKDPHEDQWKRLYELNINLSSSKEDIYDRRARSIKSLLDKYC